MRIASALLIASLGVGVTGCSRTSPSPASGVNPQPASEVVALNQQFPLDATSRGPLVAPRPNESNRPQTVIRWGLRARWVVPLNRPSR